MFMLNSCTIWTGESMSYQIFPGHSSTCCIADAFLLPRSVCLGLFTSVTHFMNLRSRNLIRKSTGKFMDKKTYLPLPSPRGSCSDTDVLVSADEFDVLQVLNNFYA